MNSGHTNSAQFARIGWVNGISLCGVICVPMSRLIAVFGQPEYNIADGKAAFYWGLRFQDGADDLRGVEASIYDWKATSLYEPGLPSPRALREADHSDWHVGGKSPRALAIVKAALGLS